MCVRINMHSHEGACKGGQPDCITLVYPTSMSYIYPFGSVIRTLLRIYLPLAESSHLFFTSTLSIGRRYINNLPYLPITNVFRDKRRTHDDNSPETNLKINF